MKLILDGMRAILEELADLQGGGGAFSGGGGNLHGRTATDVTSGKDAGHVGLHVLVSDHEANFIKLDLRGLQKLRVGAQANEDEDAICWEINLLAILGCLEPLPPWLRCRPQFFHL